MKPTGLPTPSLSHFCKADFLQIYPPSEDTFLMLDTLELEADWISSQVHPTIAAEIGTGSGCILAFLGQLFPNVLLIGSDVNRRACEATCKTLLHNSIGLGSAVQMEFLDGFSIGAGGEGKIDLLVFNPPYVPSEDCDFYENPLDLACLGGDSRGRKVIDKFIARLDAVLSSKGVGYLLLMHQNDPLDVALQLEKRGFHPEIVNKRRAGIELLYLMKIVRKL